MNRFEKRNATVKAWPWRLALAAAVALVALLAMGSGNPQGQDKVHGAVYSWAQAHRGREIPVIVQTKGPDGDVISDVQRLGGTVTQDFDIIPGFAARVPPQSLGPLAGLDQVNVISLDAPLVSTGFVDVTKLASVYPFAVNADKVWGAATPRTGAGVTVAVIDSGVSQGNADFQNSLGQSRFKFDAVVNPGATNPNDPYGHGTHVAGIIGGDGDLAAGKYVGIAPDVNFIDVKTADDTGAASVSAAISGLQWVYNNKDAYGIRVANLSFHSSVAQSYKSDPIDAAVEALWFRGVVVVAAAGNMGSAPDAVSYAPANDPFVVVVGAVDDLGTASQADDVVTTWSSRGLTQDGITKPDVVAPGRYIVSDIDLTSILAIGNPTRLVDQFYFRMSGTSMAAPVVSGVVALMLEQHPDWSPGQVKHVLTTTAQGLASDPSSREVLADRAVFYAGQLTDLNDSDRPHTPGKNKRQEFVAKIGLIASVLGAPDPQAEAALVGLDLNDIGPPGTTLDTVNWEAIKWGAIKWDAIKWAAVKWDAIKWAAIKWDFINWDAIKWSAIKWGAIKWDAIKWSFITWDAIKWTAIKWDALTAQDGTTTPVLFSNVMLDSVGFDKVTFDSLPND